MHDLKIHLSITLLAICFTWISFGQDYELNFCDDSGFVTLNIDELQEEILLNIGIQDDYYDEQILISTSDGNIIIVDSPSTNLSTNLLCTHYGSITDIAVDLNKQITFVGGNFVTVDNNCNFNFYLHSSWQVNSLSFDNLGYMYYGFGNQSYVNRVEIVNEDFVGGVWHDFQTGTSAGDFVYLSGKIYVAWKLSNTDYRLYEVTVDEDNNYVSHLDLGQIPNETYGLATELGKLYGVTVDKLYKIDLATFSFMDVLTNDNPTDQWYGAAGLHEAIAFETSIFSSLEDAENTVNQLNGNWTNTQAGNQTIYIRIDNLYNDEYDIYPIVINVYSFPVVNPPINLNECFDLEYNIFDLSVVSSQMQIDEEDSLTFTYFDKNPEVIPLAVPISNMYQSVSINEDIYVEVEENNNGCITTYGFSINNRAIPELLPISDIDSPTVLTSCYFDEDFRGYFDLNDINNDIIINTEYEIADISYYSSYSDAELNLNSISKIQYLQESVKEIFIKVINDEGCSAISNFYLMRDCFNNTESLGGIFFPKFITPNNDGFNDYWNVKGISRKVKQESIVHIFDRYGKLIFTFRPFNHVGWDGKYNGRELPQSDYWYIFKTDSGFRKTGNFTLRR